MKQKLAINGGSRIRKKKMPARYSFGNKENQEVKKMLRYYRLRGEDPKYAGHWENNYCKEFSKYMGGGFADAVATGTGAIYVAMKSLEIPKNSDVIMSAVTCSGNFSCITEQGLNPIIADSSINSYNTNLENIKKKITKKTKLIQLTHVGGEPVKDVEEIARFAKKNKIFLLEDCSQAVGAKINGKKVGTFGDVSAFSTMYRKNLAANSSGGIIFTKKYSTYKKILAYADRGKILWNKKLDLRDPKHSLFPALNWNSDEFSCAIGLANLRRLNKNINNRIKFVEYLLKNFEKNKIQSCKIDNFHKGYSPFFLPITFNSKVIKINKISFTNALIYEGIPLGQTYGCLVTTWKWAKKYLKYKCKTPNALKVRNKVFHLYLNENYSLKEAIDICKAIKKVEGYYL